jgi:hypothetical protein
VLLAAAASKQDRATKEGRTVRRQGAMAASGG